MKKSFLVYALLLCFLSFSFAQKKDFIIGADISGITEMEAKVRNCSISTVRNARARL